MASTCGGLLFLLLPIITGARALGDGSYGYGSSQFGFEDTRQGFRIPDGLYHGYSGGDPRQSDPRQSDPRQSVTGDLDETRYHIPEPVPLSKGIYYQLPPPADTAFAQRPWDPRYEPGAEDEGDLPRRDDGPPHFDRGQPEVESAFIPVYHEKRNDEEPSVAQPKAPKPNNNDLEGHVEGPIAMARVQHVEPQPESGHQGSMTQLYFVAAIAGCSAALAVGLMAAGGLWYRMRRNSKAAADTAYPAYGVTGPNKTPDLSPTGSISSGDRKLAQSAQMYHYQHQKQQMIAMGTADTEDRPGAGSDVESDDDKDEEEEGEYTVYECPGLAPTGEMEVKNPLFEDQPTPLPPEDRR